MEGEGKAENNGTRMAKKSQKWQWELQKAVGDEYLILKAFEMLLHRSVPLNSHPRNIAMQIYYLSVYRMKNYKDLTLIDLLLSRTHSLGLAIILHKQGTERLKEPGRRDDFNKTVFYA